MTVSRARWPLAGAACAALVLAPLLPVLNPRVTPALRWIAISRSRRRTRSQLHCRVLRRSPSACCRRSPPLASSCWVELPRLYVSQPVHPGCRNRPDGPSPAASAGRCHTVFAERQHLEPFLTCRVSSSSTVRSAFRMPAHSYCDSGPASSSIRAIVKPRPRNHSIRTSGSLPPWPSTRSVLQLHHSEGRPLP